MTAAAISIARFRDRLTGRNPPSPLADEIVPPPALVVAATAAEAELLAVRLRAAVGGVEDRPDPPRCVGLDDLHALHDAVADLRPGAEVVLLDVAGAIAGDLAEQGAVTRLRVAPYPSRSVHDYVAALDAQGLPGDLVGAYLWDLLDGAETAAPGAVAPTRHRDTPQLGASSSVSRAWSQRLPSLSLPPQARRWLLRHPTIDGQPAAPGCGDGLLPLGKAGMIASEGGIGKTVALIQLAVAVAVGGRWLGQFEIGAEARGRRSLICLAEEDLEEAHRRLFNIAEALRLDDEDRRLVLDRVRILAMAGMPCGLLGRDASGELVSSNEVASLQRLLQRDAGAEGWAIVAFDPLARFAGAAEIDKANNEATALVQIVESFSSAPGNPAVLVNHHSSKVARREAKADARGATALTDGLRWCATLTADGARVLFRQTKSNYSVPMRADLALVRGDGGILHAAAAGDQPSVEQQREQVLRQYEAQAARAVEVLRGVGSVSSKETLAKMLGGRLADARTAVDLAMSVGTIANTGSKKAPVFVVAQGGWETPLEPPGRRDDVRRPVGLTSARSQHRPGTTTGRHGTTDVGGGDA